MQILAEDRLTVFHTTEWIPGSGFTFAFTNGIVSSGHIQFGNPIGPPGPGLASYSYTVGDSLNTLTINGRVTTPILGADVPNQFTHTNVVATLVEAPPSIDRVELDTESIQFHFSGEPPYDYTVEYSDSLVTTNWSALATYRAKLQTIEVTVTNEFSGVGSRFFRLRKDPCYCR
jgi:hypothetical protein